MVLPALYQPCAGGSIHFRGGIPEPRGFLYNTPAASGAGEIAPDRLAPYTIVVRRLFTLLFFFSWANPFCAQTATDGRQSATARTGQALVEQALANELAAAQAKGSPMRFELRKVSPRVTTTKEIVETEDGEVARLIAVNDQPLTAAADQGEVARLNALRDDPGRQRRRKQAEDADTERALKILRALPVAFLYQDAGPGQGPAGPVEKFTFRPNPAFDPADLETATLSAMNGEIWIDPVRVRVVRLDAEIQHDVDFGWGILGRLDKGGRITIEQAEVGNGQWRTVRFQMKMSGRVVFKSRVFDTTEEQTNYAPLPQGMSYRQAIDLLLSGK